MSLFAGQSREDLRARYRQAWQRWRAGEVLQRLDGQISAVLAEHPEYHATVLDAQSVPENFPMQPGEANPFLHLGLHLALREQIATDRPAGIAQIHQRLAASLGSAHEAEHRMIEPLAETLWEAQRSGRTPDERTYFARLQRL